MQVQVQSRSFPLTDALHEFINEKLHLLLSRYADHVRLAQVVLHDANGPKGGVDMTCSITIQLHQMNTVSIQHVAADMYEAIAGCCQRIRRHVERQIERRRKIRA